MQHASNVHNKSKKKGSRVYGVSEDYLFSY